MQHGRKMSRPGCCKGVSRKDVSLEQDSLLQFPHLVILGRVVGFFLKDNFRSRKALPSLGSATMSLSSSSSSASLKATWACTLDSRAKDLVSINSVFGWYRVTLDLSVGFLVQGVVALQALRALRHLWPSSPQLENGPDFILFKRSH